MTIDPTLRGQADQEHILQSIVERLIDKVERLNDQNCFLADQAIPITHPGGRYVVTVSMGAGSYVGQMFAGAGADTITEDGSVIITVILFNNLDRPRQSIRKIIGRDDQAAGLIQWKKQILRALFGFDDRWEPTLGDQPLLREQIAPLRVDAPADVTVGEARGTAMKIIVSAVFDQKLEP